MTNRLFQIFPAIFAALIFSFTGCGEGESDSATGSLRIEEREAAWSTIVSAQVEYQISVYRIFEILSNDYQNGFLEMDPTDDQVVRVETELKHLQQVAQEAGVAYEALTGVPLSAASLRNGDLNPPAGLRISPVGLKLEDIPIIGFIYEEIEQPQKRRNEFWAIINAMNSSERQMLYDEDLPDEYKSGLSGTNDFFDKLKKGGFDDQILDLHRSLRNTPIFGAVAVSKKLDTMNVAKREGARLAKTGTQTMSVVIEGGGSMGKMATKVVTKSLWAELKNVFSGFFANKDKVTYREVDSDSPYAAVDEDERLEMATADALTGVREVVKTGSGEIVTGEGENMEINIDGILEERELDAEKVARAVRNGLAIAEQIQPVLPPTSGIPADFGVASVITGDTAPVEGFVAMRQVTATAESPEWLLGFGVGGGETDPVWMGMMPPGEWEFTLLTPAGTASETVTRTVSVSSPAVVQVTPPEDPEETGGDGNGESSWFDWVQDVNDDGSGLPFGDDDGDDDGTGGSSVASCDQRSGSMGNCVDYIDISENYMTNLASSCEGSFTSGGTCASTNRTFQCTMDLNAESDSYSIHVSVYGMDAMPTTAMQDMCDSFCATYSNGGLFTISNCSLR